MTDFLTTGKVAERLDCDRDEVAYAIRKLRINPIGHAGQAKIYANSCIEAVRAFLVNKRKRVSE